MLFTTFFAYSLHLTLLLIGFERNADEIFQLDLLQGPGCMTTETKVRFKVPSASDVDLYHKTVSANENTGYTSNHNIEPVTFHPDYAYLNDALVSHLQHSSASYYT